MNETRNPMVEDAFNDMHGIKPEIYYRRINNACYQNRIVYKGKEVIIKETMERGMAKEVLLTYEGKDTMFNNRNSPVFTAEKAAVKILGD